MKIRNGFVSNSSTASFVLSKENHSDSTSVAKIMLPIREYDNDQELVNKIDFDIKHYLIKKDSNICFHSCNYDSYIISTENYILVMTCNNHSFLNVLYPENHFPREILDLINRESIKDSEELDYEYYGHSFWFLENGLWGTPVDMEERKEEFGKYISGYCEKCFCNIIRINETKEITCPNCYVKVPPDPFKLGENLDI